MHIILFVLKIIGIILLVLLGILLGLIGLVLFVPIRYRTNLSKLDHIFAKAKVSWLFNVLCFHLLYEEEKLNWQVKVFGIRILPKREKQKKKRHPKEKVRKPRKKEPEGDFVIAEIKKENSSMNFRDIDTNNIEINDINTNDINTNDIKTNDISPNHEKEKSKKVKQKRKKVSLVDKLNGIWEWIKRLMLKKNIVFDFLKERENKAGIYKIWNSLKRMLKHLAPRKIKGWVEFGMGDPCTTGEILGAASIFYSLYGEQLTIHPNFEEACIKGEVFIKGRIRVFTLLLICIKLLVDNNFKKLKINFEKMKEAL